MGKLAALELEDMISQHDAVSEAAVIGVPDEKWGERSLALVVLKEGSELTQEALKSFFMEFVDKGTISKWAVPDRIVFTAVLAKTSVGKLNKRLMREEFKE